ncbi:MAG TPA: DUF1918 domain-containing protein [Jatrophihabitans sp.]|jgi:hypothetical protein|nr:DUF1918 domain-containing protein [Jatrophihabitans sp.]
MYADPGDWLVVKSARDSLQSRRAEILGVGGAGRPPYRVRWLDTGLEALVFPGADAKIVPAARQIEMDHAQVERANRMRSAFLATR